MEKKKIGILTFSFPENRNYGAILQTYALYTFLKKEGYDPYIIDYHQGGSSWISRRWRKVKDSTRSIGDFKIFHNKHFENKTKRIRFGRELEKLNKTTDCFIVGSDQVWRYRYTKNRILQYFFKFVEDNKTKIAYAASFGIDKWNEAPEEVTSEVQTLIKRFDVISVRENSGLSICKETFGVDATHVLDPTLLLDDSDYSNLLESNNVEGRYISVMLLDRTPDALNITKAIEEKLGVPGINTNGYFKKILGKKVRRYNKVGQWLSYLKNADFVVTDSFHCVVFSIIFRKQFICIVNKNRGLTRITSLLNMFDIKNRIVTTNLSDENMEHINYDNIESNIGKQKTISIEYLRNAINAK